MAAVAIHCDFGAPPKKVWCCFTVSPCICREVMGPDAMILVFWMLSFKPAFLLSSWYRIPHSNPQQEKRSLSNKRFTLGLTTLSTIPYYLLRTKAVSCAMSQPICDFFCFFMFSFNSGIQKKVKCIFTYYLC